MKIILIIVLCIILYLLILIEKKSWLYENYSNMIDLADIKTDESILNQIRSMLKDIDRIFNEYNLMYWMDGGTLLGAIRHKDIIPWDDDGDISILDKDENKLLSLEPQLNNLGYGLSSFWGGYKIYPLSGSEIKYYNKNLQWNNSAKDIWSNKTINYRYPFVDVFLVNKENSEYHFSNKKVRNIWPSYYHIASDLFPLKRYKFNCFELCGPNNPMPYLDRSYGLDWKVAGYRQYDHEHQKVLDNTKFNINSMVK